MSGEKFFLYFNPCPAHVMNITRKNKKNMRFSNEL